MASILDIEDTLSDNTTQEIVLKDWYWNEFIPKLDEDNIRNDYRLVYNEFSEHEWMSFPYNYPEHAWEWLLENKILVISGYSDLNLYELSDSDKYEDKPMPIKIVDGCCKYRLADKFFNDYQMLLRKRRSAETTESFETWLYYLDCAQKHGFNTTWYDSRMKNYEWPITYKYNSSI